MNNSTIARTLARGIRLSIAAALLTGLLAVTQPARAATYFVTTTASSGVGSLRRAIDDAYFHPGPDTITFNAAATNGKPIVLAGATGDDANISGDLDILDGGDLKIQGNGATKTYVDGGWIDRVFHVCPGGGCANTVTFIGMTIRNGDTTGNGGGIYNEAGTTIVKSSIIRTNTANGGGGIYNKGTLYVQNGSTIGGAGAGNTAFGGGGIVNYGGFTTVDGSTVSANVAYDGGGIYNWGTLTVQNGSTIGGTGASNTAANDGGGIYNYDGNTTVDGSTIRTNSATTSGGGIYNNATLNVRNGSTVRDNIANSGGGIYNDDLTDTTTVDSSAISANTAGYGGGIYNSGTLTVQNGSTIGGAGAGNIVTNVGGGIYNGGYLTPGPPSTTTVDGSTVSANTSDDWAGGIYNMGTLTIQNVTGSRILNNTTSTNGGGVYTDRDNTGTTSVTGSCIVGNSAMSYFNDQVAQQNATGNWWGAATGPNTPGADTVGGNVDTSGHLTVPILGCGFDVYLPLVLK
jgi:hypothetical protein